MADVDLWNTDKRTPPKPKVPETRTVRAEAAQLDRHDSKPANTVKPDVESWASESLVKRAKKRSVRELGDRWLVAGDPKLGDTRPTYTVKFEPDMGKYVCACYMTHHGGTRSRKMCSHVLAVIMYRRDNKGGRSESTSPPSSCGVSQPASTTPDDDVGRQGETSTGPRLSGQPKVDRDVDSDVPPVAAIPGDIPLPSWITELRPHQWQAVQEIVDLFASGVKVVFLDAPTGSGKTLIGELVRRMLDQRAIYVCSSLALQDQFKEDFPYAQVLKGRSNYPTQLQSFPEVTCADCTKTPGPLDEAVCDWCSDVPKCAYQDAKKRASRSPLTIINTAYLLNEANFIGGFSGRGLGNIDECDVLESELMNFVSFGVTDRVIERLGLEAPKKGSHYTTIIAWLTGELQPAVNKYAAELRAKVSRAVVGSVADIRSLSSAERLQSNLDQVVSQMVDGDGEMVRDAGKKWVRDNDAGPMTLKPIRVDEFGQQMLWRHAQRWLCMSATIISPDEMADSLGLRDNEWGVVRVPMTFPVENRPIRIAGVANMTAKNKAEAWPQMVESVLKVCELHPDERVLVHAVSYDLTAAIVARLRASGLNRPVVTYRSAGEREGAIQRYRAEPGSVLVAPSLDRGVDFKGDDCRVVVVTKVPFPYLGDKQVSGRANGPGGNTWYAVQTVRKIVQMTGRGVRSESDWCVTYILDKQFTDNIYKRNKALFPKWWREAIDTRFPTRELR